MGTCVLFVHLQRCQTKQRRELRVFGEELKTRRLGCGHCNRAAITEKRSAVRWASRITAPLLITYGGDDTTVNPAHALQLARALQRSGKPYELMIAAGARHVPEPFEAERDERAIRWFRRHMREEPP